MLKVWGRRSALNVQKVLWLIDELGLAHSHVDAGGAFGGLDDPGFLAMNPHGRVPVIDDGGFVVWESHSFIRYLAARHGAGTIWPDDPAGRSLADRWMDWSLATLQRDFMDLFWGYHRTPEAQRDRVRIDELIANCDRHYRFLDRQLADRAYLAGAAFTMADILAGTTLYRYFTLDLPRAPMPHVEAWYGRLAERPAYRAHVMRPYGELKARLDF